MRTWQRMGGGDWPTEAHWASLREADRLEALEPERELATADHDLVELTFGLPMPAISFVELVRA